MARIYSVYSWAEIERVYYALRDRMIHPVGGFDKGGRWYTHAECSCCKVRTPSRKYPYSELLHCRTRKHVQALARERGSDFAALLRAADSAISKRQELTALLAGV